MTGQTLYTVTEAAALVGVHPNTLRNWERDRQLPVIPLRTPGGHRRFTEQHVAAIRDALRPSLQEGG